MLMIYHFQLVLLPMLLLLSISLDGTSPSSSVAASVYRQRQQQQPKKIYTTNKLQTEMGRNITRILNSFFSSGYDKRVRPSYAGKC